VVPRCQVWQCSSIGDRILWPGVEASWPIMTPKPDGISEADIASCGDDSIPPDSIRTTS